MKGTFHKSIVVPTMLYIILAVYFLAVCLINFSAAPSFYDSDMYCDYRYAMEVWEHKSIFPDGWVFGNQLNAVSTPVLAALIYGLSDNMNFSMAAACTIMAVMVLVCYDWMIRPVIKDTESRLVATVLFITVVLYCGAAVRGNQGWTLLFTMCSYYAGYSITAFLAFGCYIRGLSDSHKNPKAIIVLTCVLSFGTGIQSIRQTAIMIAPLFAVEFLRMLLSLRTWKDNKRPFWIAAAIACSNFLGLCYVRMREINQNQIFGAIEITSLRDLRHAANGCFSMINKFLEPTHPEAFVILAVLEIICVGSLILIFRNMLKERKAVVPALALLIGASVLVIVVIDIFTTMYVRPRYYFMLYPFMGFLVAYAYDSWDVRIKRCLLTLLITFALVACIRELPGVCTSAIEREQEDSYDISAYLLENGYTTVYAEWNLGHDVAVASNGKIDTGYWYVEESPFEKVTHLCSLDIYRTDPGRCVYLFEGMDDAAYGIAAAEAAGVPLQLLCHFPETETYLYTASENLMQIVG